MPHFQSFSMNLLDFDDTIIGERSTLMLNKRKTLTSIVGHIRSCVILFVSIQLFLFFREKISTFWRKFRKVSREFQRNLRRFETHVCSAVVSYVFPNTAKSELWPKTKKFTVEKCQLGGNFPLCRFFDEIFRGFIFRVLLVRS